MIHCEPQQWTAADLRAERARRQVPIFLVASRVGIHPARLGQILNGKYPLSTETAARIAKALGFQPASGAAL